MQHVGSHCLEMQELIMLHYSLSKDKEFNRTCNVTFRY